MSGSSEYTQAKADPTSYWLGPVVAFHEVGRYRIIEYRPEIFKRCTGTGEYEKKRTAFSIHMKKGRVVIDCHHSFASLDAALAGVIAYRHEGCNHHADLYFIAALERLKGGKG